MTGTASNNEHDFRPCPICGKMVQVEVEAHTLYACRNFLLKQYYREMDSRKRKKLENKVDEVNAKLGTSSKNLVDT
jgi:hypothetical protein